MLYLGPEIGFAVLKVVLLNLGLAARLQVVAGGMQIAKK